MLKPIDNLLLFGAIFLKVWLLVSWPLTGYEAQWISWSQAPGLGHHDHGPMVGWVLALMQLHSNELWWLRGLGILSSLVVSWAVYLVLSVAEPSLVFRRRHLLVALAFFVSPLSLVFFATAETTVFGLFAFLGFAAQVTGVIGRSVFWALLGGLLLGGALLTNYLVAVPILGLLLFALLRAGLIGWGVPVATLIGLLPSIGIVAVYNYGHCWNNMLSDFFVPLQDGDWGVDYALVFMAMLLFFGGPWSLWHWTRCGGRHTGILRTELGFMVRYASLPVLAVLFLISLRHPLGPQWPVLLIPMFWLLLRALPEAALTSIYRWSALSALGIGLVASVILSDPARWISNSDRQALSLQTHPKLLCERLPEGALFVLDPHTRSILSVACNNQQVHAFANRSGVGREADLNIDWQEFNSQEMKLLLSGGAALAQIEPFFESVATTPLDVNGEKYTLATASGFRYEAYREQVIQPVVKKFYEAPYWFPQAGACPIRERYGL